MSETPPCRECGKTATVAAFWPENPERTICVECCPLVDHEDGETGHVFKHDPPERDYVCIYCGQFARNTDYYDGRDEP